MKRKAFLGEFLGTFIMVLFGTGAVAVSVLFNSHPGLFEIAITWGIAITLGIYMTRQLCCAHFNPAVTIAMAAAGRLPARRVPIYLAAQFTGAFGASLLLYLLFAPSITAYEAAHKIVRGTFASVATAKMFGEYYLQPGGMHISMGLAMAAEGLGTFLLVLTIFLLTEKCNSGKPDNNLAPIFIGLTITSLISLIAPLTQAGFNPARDFAPRLVALLFGWKTWAFPDHYGGFFWVYMLGPVLGGLLAALVYVKVIEPTLTARKVLPAEGQEEKIMKSELILVGGFLGAGKTSLLWSLAHKLAATGRPVSLITNDQASELVDTTFLKNGTGIVKEVSGSCFCCNFPGFIAAVKSLHEQNPGGVIIAEPVGSCTDLSATIMQPLKDKYADIVDIRPLSVLVDPHKLTEILADSQQYSHYIMRKQLEEADIILINKTDLLNAAAGAALQTEAQQRFPQAQVLTASVKNDTGVKEWYRTLPEAPGVGRQLAVVDYDVYAAGEAAYGWLNATYQLTQAEPGETQARELLDRLQRRFRAESVVIGHVKFLLAQAGQLLLGNITDGKAENELRAFAGPDTGRRLIVNARAELAPERLTELIRSEIQAVFGSENCVQTAFKCLIPGRPNPTYRYHEVM